MHKVVDYEDLFSIHGRLEGAKIFRIFYFP